MNLDSMGYHSYSEPEKDEKEKRETHDIKQEISLSKKEKVFLILSKLLLITIFTLFCFFPLEGIFVVSMMFVIVFLLLGLFS